MVQCNLVHHSSVLESLKQSFADYYIYKWHYKLWLLTIVSFVLYDLTFTNDLQICLTFTKVLGTGWVLLRENKLRAIPNIYYCPGKLFIIQSRERFVKTTFWAYLRVMFEDEVEHSVRAQERITFCAQERITFSDFATEFSQSWSIVWPFEPPPMNVYPHLRVEAPPKIYHCNPHLPSATKNTHNCNI